MTLVLIAGTACHKKSAPAPATNPTSPEVTTTADDAQESARERRQYQRLVWNLKTLVEAYAHAGYTNSAWDAPARTALAEFAHVRADAASDNQHGLKIVAANAAAAIQSGCKDPMVTYLYVRFALDPTSSPAAICAAYDAMARAMHNSSYAPLRKFYATIRTDNQYYATYGTNVTAFPSAMEISTYLSADALYSMLDTNTPPEEIYELCSEDLQGYETAPKLYAQAYPIIENAVFTGWPNEATSWLLKGEANYQMAWHARGGGYANDVSAAGWKGFGDHLATAEAALNRAWQLDPDDPRIPTAMMNVVADEQKGRDVMELWFSRAMAVDPDNYKACRNKLRFLYPQWYGSREEMIAFGRVCVATTNWGGDVPLILVDAHTDYNNYSNTNDADREAYWRQPEVWPDIKAAYERYFTLNPDATDLYKNYAWYAYQAGQWAAFNGLAKKVRPADFDFFGGKNALDQMVQFAQTQSSQAQ